LLHLSNFTYWLFQFCIYSHFNYFSQIPRFMTSVTFVINVLLRTDELADLPPVSIIFLMNTWKKLWHDLRNCHHQKSDAISLGHVIIHRPAYLTGSALPACSPVSILVYLPYGINQLAFNCLVLLTQEFNPFIKEQMLNAVA